MLTLTAVLFRATGILQVLITALAHGAESAHAGWMLALTGAVCGETVPLSVYWLRGRRIGPAAMTADIAFCVAALAANAALIDTRDALTWAFFMYGFTMLSCIGIGVAYVRYRSVLAATAALAAGYVLSSLLFGLERPWNAVPDTISYFADTSVTWLVARELRRSAREQDAMRARAVADAAALATERERLRHARVLHDRVLQTLEALARGPWIADGPLRTHVAEEAAWLRALILGDPVDRHDDLLTALQDVVSRSAGKGLDVQLVDSSLRRQESVRQAVDAAAVGALCGAVEEALTNVSKHAGVTRAVVHAAATPSRVSVSVVDHGRGFDLARQPLGWGLPQSIRHRLHEIGGRVRIDTSPGAGTSVELVLDVASAHAERAAGTRGYRAPR
jgi:signal transduction histidine kinase